MKTLNQPVAMQKTGRAGLSLMEILVSVFVLSIGLLGVLAAIPFGGYQMNVAQTADYTGNLGRSATVQVRTNDWVNPKYWNIDYTQSPYNNNGTLNCIAPFLIDPLALGVRAEPYWMNLGIISGVNGGNAVSLPKISLKLTPEAIDEFFFSHDDLMRLNEEEIDGIRPQYTAEGLDGNDGIDSPLFWGYYSWMFMVTPQLLTTDYLNVNDVTGIGGYDVDVVVFNKRILPDSNTGNSDPRDERALDATLTGSGLKGGTLNVRFSENSDISPQEALDFSKGTHVLIAGPDAYNTGRLWVKWFKVANYSEPIQIGNSTDWEADLTVCGSDFPVSWENGNANVKVIVFAGVTGVYSSMVLNQKL